MYELIDDANMTPELEIFVDEFDFLEFDDIILDKDNGIDFLSNDDNSYEYSSYNTCFNNLKDKYFNDKFEFYCLCKKSQIFYNSAFHANLENRVIDIFFQTERYDLIMKFFISAINCLKKCLILCDKRLKSINNFFLKDIEYEKSKINFIIAENYDLSCKSYDYIINKKDYNDSTCPLACYSPYLKEITLFANSKNKPKFKRMLDDINHELGHFLNLTMSCQREINKNLYLNALKKDTKLAFKNQKIINSGSALLRGWYNHLSPKRDFSLWSKTEDLLFDSNSGELFAESFAEVMESKYANKKSKRTPKKTKKINDLFPNTKYFIEKMLAGKRPNRFKSIKLKKQPTR